MQTLTMTSTQTIVALQILLFEHSVITFLSWWVVCEGLS